MSRNGYPISSYVPIGIRQVCFMELALDFDAHSSERIPMVPQAKYKGTVP